ncbi:MAG: hypothetical protein U5K79_14360 [Cyclobacteriaceae bacterium]|nr:hypothetical protein [Cyclobacteriaceae bacterium]
MAIYNSLENQEVGADSRHHGIEEILSPEIHRLKIEKQNFIRREDVKVMINGADIKGASVAVIALEEY